MATSRAGGSAAAPGRTGVRLFAASARNLVPRLIASLATGAVAWVYVGPLWTAVWFAGTWAFLMAGIGLMRLINARAAGIAANRLSFLLSLNSMASSTIGAAMSFAIWACGDDLARAFAIIVLFIAAAYVLLHYYAELKTFLVLMSPYALALGYDRRWRRATRVATMPESPSTCWRLGQASSTSSTFRAAPARSLMVGPAKGAGAQAQVGRPPPGRRTSPRALFLATREPRDPHAA